MSDESKKRPTHIAYAVRNFTNEGEENASWLKIGAAWEHKDAKEFDVVLEATPVTGRIILRANKPNP